MTAEDGQLEDLIDRYLLGIATSEQIDRLNEQLAGSERLRKIYRFRVALEGGYREAAIRFAATDSADAQLKSPDAIPLETAGTSQQNSRRSFLSGFALAAASLTVVAAVLVFAWTPKDADQTPPATIARLVTSVDAAWQGKTPLPGAWLAAGNFQLESGTIELQFSRGARVTLQGPADFDVLGAELLHVSAGNLVARIPEEAIGFTITTSETEVVDLGTEFGLRVGHGRQTEVHVIEGLVEVFERDASRQRGQDSIRLKQGQAVRWSADAAEKLGAESIPVQSSRGVVGGQPREQLGLTFLQGNIRLKENVARHDLKRQATSWIEVIPESRAVLLEQDLPVTLNSPGNYRVFPASTRVLAQGTRVDSYLFHFRSEQPAPIGGVIKFDREVLGVICEADQLAVSDPVVGRSGMQYPVGSKQYRGLEPRDAVNSLTPERGGGWSADGVTISQDRRTVGLSVNVNPRQGVDQLRVLVRSRSQP